MVKIFTNGNKSKAYTARDSVIISNSQVKQFV